MRNCNYSILLVFFCVNLANAMFAIPTNAPIDRLIANTTAFIKENPKNAHGYYTLGRIHYLAFANKAFLIPTIGNSSPPKIAPGWEAGTYGHHARSEYAIKLTLKHFGYQSISDVPEAEKQKFLNLLKEKENQLAEQGWPPERPDDQQLVEHAVAALRNFKKAIELDPQNSLYHLGLASVLEQYVQFLKETKTCIFPEEFRSIILDKAKEIYYTAYSLSIRKDLKHKYIPIEGLRSLVGYEAGKAYVRLSEADASISEDQKKKVAKIKKDVQKLDALPIGSISITPIIFSLEKHSSLLDLEPIRITRNNET